MWPPRSREYIESRTLSMSVPLGIPSHVDRQFEQFRTQVESHALGGLKVDFKAHFVSVQDELDHAAAPRELGRVADGQDTRSIQLRQNLFQLTIRGGTDERDAA